VNISLAIGVGVGIGVPVIILIVAVIVLIFLRREGRNRQENDYCTNAYIASATLGLKQLCLIIIFLLL